MENFKSISNKIKINDIIYTLFMNKRILLKKKNILEFASNSVSNRLNSLINHNKQSYPKQSGMNLWSIWFR